VLEFVVGCVCEALPQTPAQLLRGCVEETVESGGYCYKECVLWQGMDISLFWFGLLLDDDSEQRQWLMFGRNWWWLEVAYGFRFAEERGSRAKRVVYKQRRRDWTTIQCDNSTPHLSYYM